MNVIVIKTDQQRFDTLGCMGNEVIRTPHLDRLAADGVVMENAFCCSPLCVPSRVSFFTGKYVHRTGVTDNATEHHLQRGQWSFVDLFREQGYAVGLAGKNHAFHDEYLADRFDSREEYGHWGKTHGTIRESDREVRAWLHDEPRPAWRLPSGAIMEGLVEEPMPFAPEVCPTARIAEDAIAFVEAHREEPFLLHCSFPDPHFPNVLPEPWFSMYAADEVALEGLEIDWTSHPFAHFVQSQSSGFDEYTEEERRRLLAIYYGQVSFIDEAVGRLLDWVEALGLSRRTAVVFTSDHGDFAGRYGLIGKTKAFSEPVVRIPLILRLPGVSGGQRVAAEVSNIDVMPTLAELLGLPVPGEVQGRSFLPVLRGETDSHREAIFAEVGSPELPPPAVPMESFGELNRRRQAEDGIFWFIEYTCRGRAAMIRTDGWKYCYYTGDTPELYDLEADPLELTNLAGNPACAEREQGLRDRLLEWLLASPVG